MQARITAIERACTPVAERLPAYALLRTIPRVGPTVGAILLAEIGEIAWFTKFSQLRKLAGLDIVRVQTPPQAGPVADLQVRAEPAALGAVPSRDGSRANGRRPGSARGPPGEAARRSVRRFQGHRRVGREGAPDRLGRVAERDPV